MNAGQVGGLRAAQFISIRYGGPPLEEGEFKEAVKGQVEEKLRFAENALGGRSSDDEIVRRARKQIRQRMTIHGAHIRDPRYIQKAAAEAWKQLKHLRSRAKISSSEKLPEVFRILDLCWTHIFYLEAIGEYLSKGGQSRGSYLVKDPKGRKPCETLEEEWRFSLTRKNDFVSRHICEISLAPEGSLRKSWVEIRPIPEEESWFENVWNDFIDGRIIQ